MQSVSSASTSLEPLQPARWSLAPMAQKQLEQNQLIDLAVSKRPKKSQVKTLSPHIHVPSLVAYKDGAWGSSLDQASKSSQDREARHVCPSCPMLEDGAASLWDGYVLVIPMLLHGHTHTCLLSSLGCSGHSST